MRVIKPLLAIILVQLLVWPGPVQAIDDFDFDALFDVDVEEEVAPEPTPEVDEMEEADVDLPGEDDWDIEDVEVEPEVPSVPEEPVDEPTPPDEPAPVEADDDNDDWFIDDDDDFLFPEDDMDLEPEPEIEPELEPEVVEEDEIDDWDLDWDDPAPAEEPIDEPEIDEDWEEEQVIEDEVEAEPAEVAPTEPRDEIDRAAREVSRLEEVRRQAREVEGLQALDAGYRALEQDEFRRAINHFETAREMIPDRTAREEELEQANWGLAEANFRRAQEIYRDDGDMREARRHLERAVELSPGHRGTSLLQRRIAREEARRVAEEARPVPIERRPEVAERRADVKEMMREAKAFYDAGELQRAEVVFENVLVRDEYNTDAMRYLRRIAEDRRRAVDRLRETTTEQMMLDVRAAWNPPRRDEVVLPEDVVGVRPTDMETPSQLLQRKMEEIVLPRVEFRQANIVDVVAFLRDASEAADPEGEGVNIILNLSVPDSPAAPAPAAPAGAFDDPWGDEWDSPAPAASPGVSGIPSITLNLRRISLMEAVRYITEVAGLRFRLEDNAVVITPAGVADMGRVVTRLYPVQPSFLDIISERRDDSPPPAGGFEFGTRRARETGSRTSDVKAFFEGAGVSFPVGTSISYNPAISQLIVANTPENLETFERILAQLNVVPSQVEIEARFVEVAEDDLQELGLQWIFTDNYEFLQRQGAGPFGGRERIQIDAGNVTSGNRFFGRTASGIEPIRADTADANFLGNILSVSSILTNPELNVVLHALSQNGNTDVLSAPRVTTRSGVNASIEVVREIIYPTEFRQEVRDLDVLDPETGARITRSIVNVTPDNFEMRKVGVILNVTPTVGPDGYTIDLALAPEVAELQDWLQYGSQQSGEQINIPQPVFSSRNVQTSIVIWDGQTVVMGGLMQERVISYKDKVPLLGDIPLIGRLFRSEGTRSRKENLLIFVTARLVDPAGKPIHRADGMTGMVGVEQQ